MKEMFEIFMTSPLHIQTLLVGWGLCVVTFYSTVIYGVGMVVVSNLKKVI